MIARFPGHLEHCWESLSARLIFPSWERNHKKTCVVEWCVSFGLSFFRGRTMGFGNWPSGCLGFPGAGWGFGSDFSSTISSGGLDFGGTGWGFGSTFSAMISSSESLRPANRYSRFSGVTRWPSPRSSSWSSTKINVLFRNSAIQKRKILLMIYLCFWVSGCWSRR